MTVNAIIMTVRGRKDLTAQCLRSMVATLDGEQVLLSLVDAGEGSEKILYSQELNVWLGGLNGPVIETYFHEPGCGISTGWNIAIERANHYWHNEEMNCWLLNNDVVFKKPGWLKLLAGRLAVPGTGMVGCYGMSVFGHPFVTGGIWGFRYFDASALVLAEGGGDILDEHFDKSLQDVDLSLRFAKAGYTVTHVPGLEHGEDPYMVHSVSSTGLTLHGSEAALRKLREPERRAFIDKWGRKDGKEGYEGVVE